MSSLLSEIIIFCAKAYLKGETYYIGYEDGERAGFALGLMVAAIIFVFGIVLNIIPS